MMNQNKNSEQVFTRLQNSAQQAITCAEAAVQTANSAFNSMCSSKKMIDNLSHAISETQSVDNSTTLRELAQLASCTAFATLHELKDTVCATTALTAHATAVQRSIVEVSELFDRSKKTLLRTKLQDQATEENRRLALEIVDQAKSSFLANMSHEIRTPLAAIVGFAEIVSGEISETSKNPEISSHVDAILRNSKHLLALINDVLDISKIDSGALELEKNSVSIRDELNQIVQMLTVKAKQHNDTVIISCPDDFPSLIVTDPTKLRQILINLISNAIKFTEHGTIQIRVEQVMGVHDSNLMKIQIVDSGIGIAPGNQSKLFSSYGQADRSTARRFGGTGLGLMLAKKLARFLGGDVQLVKSALGYGSTFEIHLPLVIAESARSVPDDYLQPFTKASSSIQGCRVLLAEDSSDMQNLVGHIIKSRGGEIKFAKNGRDAVEKATEGQFDMILMDVEMPILDGNEANKQLRKKGIKVPIIAFTAHAFINKEHFNNAVYDDYITKPITSNQLLKTINRWYHPIAIH